MSYSPSTSPKLLGVFANASVLQAAYTAATFPGSVALVGAAAPYAIYQSDGNSWVNSSPSQFATSAQGTLAGTALQPGGQLTQAAVNGVTPTGAALAQSASPNAALTTLGVSGVLTEYRYILGQNSFGTAGVTQQTTLAVPAHIQTNGGFIYVDGASGGGGGGGGTTSGTNDVGGGGGGAAWGCCMLPVWVPAGTATLYLQVGAGGAGCAANTSPAAANDGGITYIRIGSHSGSYLLRLSNGLSGLLGTAGGTAGKGGTNASYVYSGGVGGSGATSGAGGSPSANTANAADFVVSGRMWAGGTGGGGAGATASLGGSSGWSIGIWGNQASGAGAGGAGGAAPWGIAGTNIPVLAPLGVGGNGGAGGASPAAGTAATAFGGGGGGGGKGFAGGKGGDGFLRLFI